MKTIYNDIKEFLDDNLVTILKIIGYSGIIISVYLYVMFMIMRVCA